MVKVTHVGIFVNKHAAEGKKITKIGGGRSKI